MSQLSRQAEQVLGGAGEWIIKNGKFFDPVRGMYIIKCGVCKKAHYHKRIDAKVCGDACRMKKSRASKPSLNSYSLSNAEKR